MTHEELLAKIDNVGHATEYGHTIETARVVNQLSALRAVVELHRPYLSVYGLACYECEESQPHPYPCPTIQAIEEHLK